MPCAQFSPLAGVNVRAREKQAKQPTPWRTSENVPCCWDHASRTKWTSTGRATWKGNTTAHWNTTRLASGANKHRRNREGKLDAIEGQNSVLRRTGPAEQHWCRHPRKQRTDDSEMRVTEYMTYQESSSSMMCGPIPKGRRARVPCRR